MKQFRGKPEYMDDLIITGLKGVYPDAFQGEYVLGDLVVRDDGQPFIMLSCVGANKNVIINNFTGTAVYVDRRSIEQFVEGYWDELDLKINNLKED